MDTHQINRCCLSDNQPIIETHLSPSESPSSSPISRPPGHRTIQRAVSNPRDNGCTFKGYEFHQQNICYMTCATLSPTRSMWDKTVDAIPLIQANPCTPTDNEGCLFTKHPSYTPKQYDLQKNQLYLPDLGSTPRKRTYDVLSSSISSNRILRVRSYCEAPETSHIVTPLQNLKYTENVPYRGATLPKYAADLILLMPERFNDNFGTSQQSFESPKAPMTLKTYQPQRAFSFGSNGLAIEDVKVIFQQKSSSAVFCCDQSNSLPVPSVHMAKPLHSDSDSFTSSSISDDYPEEDDVSSLWNSNTVHNNSSNSIVSLNSSLCTNKERHFSDVSTLKFVDPDPLSDEDLSILYFPPLVPRRDKLEATQWPYDTCVERDELFAYAPTAKGRRTKNAEAMKWLQSISVHRVGNRFVAEAVSSKFLRGQLSAKRHEETVEMLSL